MKKILIVISAVLAVASFTGCKKKGGDSGAALAKMTEFKDKMCKCSEGDMECAKKVSDEMTKWGESQPKPKEGATPKADPKAEEVGKQMGECMAKAMTPKMGSDMGSAAGGTDPAGGSGAAPAGGSSDPAAGGSGAAPAGGSSDPAAGGSGAAPAGGSAEEKK